MSSSLAGLKPERLWKHFEDITRIPHGSGDEKALGDHLIAAAKGLGLEAKKDKVGNVIVRQPASSGKENAPVIILQGHQDMVNEKNSDVVHDFKKDPLKPVLRDGWVQASGTTLGADNGIGVAACLAIMEDRSLVHGPLEHLFTVEEETGLTGARQIGADALKGKILLNLDSEEEGAFTIGCAGGADSEIRFPLKRKASASKAAFKLRVFGLRGGHSGLDINQGRGNAIKLLARLLWQTGQKFDFELVRIEGGNKRNAIPREAWAEILLPSAKAKALTAHLQAAADKIKAEFQVVDPGFQIALDPVGRKKADWAPVAAAAKDALIDFLLACPHGVVAMHPEIAGLVETSTNLAIIKTAKDKAVLICSTRSSIGSALEATRQVLKAVCALAGAGIKQPEGYPGWKPNLQSPLLKTMKAIQLKVMGQEARIIAVHAGLECGIIGEKFPGMDMISLGPTLQNPHSPDERVNAKSVENFWTLLTATLRELAG